jgi:hypothetical protein
MLDIPVWLEGRLAGVLCHEHVGAMRSWSAEEEDFATSVSHVVSSGLAARAHTRAEADTRRAAFLDSVSRLASSLDAREIADRPVSLCVQWFADYSTIVQSRNGVLELLALQYRDPLKREALMEHFRSTGWSPRLPMRVMRQGQSLLLPEATPEVTAGYGFTEADQALIDLEGSIPMSDAERNKGMPSWNRSSWRSMMQNPG